MVAAVATPAVLPAHRIELPPAMPQQPPAAAGAFEAALDAASAGGPGGDLGPALRGMLGTLDRVNGEARSVADFAHAAESSGKQLTPGEIVQLTMRCQEFMFHCQLTANIANRSSDGIQQLFRQQS